MLGHHLTVRAGGKEEGHSSLSNLSAWSPIQAETDWQLCTEALAKKPQPFSTQK